MPRYFMLIVASAVAIAIGCGSDDGLARVAVSGTVKMAGENLAGGSISIVPDAGHTGPAANGSIDAGRFSFSSADGPVAGPHRFIVTIMPTKHELIEMRASGKDIQTSWEFPMTIPEESSFEHDFTLSEPTVTDVPSDDAPAGDEP
jgi:hypothetical protein